MVLLTEDASVIQVNEWIKSFKAITSKRKETIKKKPVNLYFKSFQFVPNGWRWFHDHFVCLNAKSLTNASCFDKSIKTEAKRKQHKNHRKYKLNTKRNKKKRRNKYKSIAYPLCSECLSVHCDLNWFENIWHRINLFVY